jgi:alpha-D-ribose 1-methylphosphonate 5-triphosphate synthase subunit PhnH
MTMLARKLPEPGFGDPGFDSQTSFRAVLAALSRPGTVQTVTAPQAHPAPLSVAATSLALTLFDHVTPIWLDAAADQESVRGFLRFHCGCPFADDPSDAAFAVICDAAAMPGLHSFAVGEDQYPDSSTTVIIDLASLTGGPSVTLSGPGIAATSEIAPAGLPDDFWDQIRANRSLFPLGVDVVLTAGDQVMGIPRSITAEA